jgi:SAM-dependent methyltransferase
MKSFDQQYFDKWYRSRAHRVRTREDLRRRAALAIAVAEHVLERPVRRVLDVGCGEGEWSIPVLALRPRATYVGIEPSDYAVRRFGKRRNITFGTFAALDDVAGLERFDLVVCADVLHYLTRAEITRGASVLGRRLSGVALLHAFVRGDELEGDLQGLTRRPASWYRQTFSRAGLTSLGMGYWAPESVARTLSPLDTP